ncbi:hypothetical protein K8B33_01705 [Alcanivorax sp. JB21]|uniref:hypothetical protein n=1 Tax=Alcanivorax limicola TaxID=2874102 RepID=UPI001CBD5BCD|nr:hypothetical protein [Alcanivorax limicola]MBZ2187802.1 hypothetical protein [Alcanivorax limicola]
MAAALSACGGSSSSSGGGGSRPAPPITDAALNSADDVARHVSMMGAATSFDSEEGEVDEPEQRGGNMHQPAARLGGDGPEVVSCNQGGTMTMEEFTASRDTPYHDGSFEIFVTDSDNCRQEFSAGPFFSNSFSNGRFEGGEALDYAGPGEVLYVFMGDMETGVPVTSELETDQFRIFSEMLGVQYMCEECAGTGVSEFEVFVEARFDDGDGEVRIRLGADENNRYVGKETVIESPGGLTGDFITDLEFEGDVGFSTAACNLGSAYYRTDGALRVIESVTEAGDGTLVYSDTVDSGRVFINDSIQVDFDGGGDITVTLGGNATSYTRAQLEEFALPCDILGG